MAKENVTRIQLGQKPSNREIGAAPDLSLDKISTAESLGNAEIKERKQKALQKRNRRIIALGLVTLTIAGASLIIFLISRGRSGNQSPSGISSRTSSEFGTVGTASFETDKSISEQEALALVEAAISNRDSAQVSDYFILSENQKNSDIVESLESLEKKNGKIINYRWLAEVLANSRIVTQVVVLYEKNGKKTNRLAQMTASQNGKWRIDFDSYMRATSHPWETILSTKNQPFIVRIFIAKDTYYNLLYSDDSAWQAYALVSPDVDKILYGYVKRSSPQAEALEKIVASEEKIIRATVEIIARPESGGRQFEITRVHAENWLLGDQPFDQGF